MIDRACTANGRILGRDNPSSKFTDADVEHIKRLRAAGRTYQQIAAEVGCCLAYAQKVIVGKLRQARPARTVRTLTAEDLPTVRACYAHGYGAERIARALRASFSSTLLLVNEAKRLDGPPAVRQCGALKLTLEDVARIAGPKAALEPAA